MIPESLPEPLPEGLVEGLSRPGAYANDPSAAAGVSTVQTHISHLFLTAERVYKLRKAVALGFLDFGTRQIRRECPTGSRKSAAMVNTSYPTFCISAMLSSSRSRCAFSIQRCS